MSLTSIWDAHVDEEARKEAEQASAGGKVIAPGTYRLTCDKFEEKEFPADSLYTPGVQYINLWVLASNADLGVANSRQFIKITPLTVKRSDGRLDTMTKLWVQYEKALGVAGKSPKEVVDAITSYPVDARIGAQFTKADGSKVYANTVQEYEGYVKDGLEGRNFVQAIMAVKG
jgi:hypothetical protein